MRPLVGFPHFGVFLVANCQTLSQAKCPRQAKHLGRGARMAVVCLLGCQDGSGQPFGWSGRAKNLQETNSFGGFRRASTIPCGPGPSPRTSLAGPGHCMLQGLGGPGVAMVFAPPKKTGPIGFCTPKRVGFHRLLHPLACKAHKQGLGLRALG